jgi:hypothetical protein
MHITCETTTRIRLFHQTVPTCFSESPSVAFWVEWDFKTLDQVDYNRNQDKCDAFQKL